MVKEINLKWIKFADTVVRNVENIISIYKRIVHDYAKENKLLKEIKSKASKGYLPDPDYLEKLAYESRNLNILCLAALIHREIARFIASIYMSQKKYLNELVGAYVEAISLFLTLMLADKTCESLMRELLVTFSELSFIIDKEGAKELTGIKYVLESIIMRINKIK